MTPKILIVGGSGGSWAIRGHQIGRALGARVTSTPSADDWSWADVVILVKRAIDTWGAAARSSRARIIWDVLDFWPNPDENNRPIAELVGEVSRRRDAFGVSVLIGATQKMAAAIGGVYLPHHSRHGLQARPVSPVVRVVAYEGTPKYLGSWRRALEHVCADRGLSFMVNPPDLSVADVIVALRGERWDGAVCQQWKSGVKYVNAIAAGRPVITQASAAYYELGTPGSIIEHPSDLPEALDVWASVDARQSAFDRCALQAQRYALDAVAQRYRSIIADAVRQAA